ncbi:CD151 antigen-like [Eriocheir sinensis]|uniref:CD151 antigen-like n=1 Tax=Eriocheir sinensis TaxID=95602 RepID=UPI0021C97804|nr:CD151 antigen-like [Eriocheir sinensis]
MHHSGSSSHEFRKGPGPRGRGCCSVSFLKYVLFIFNFLFLVGGVAVLSVAAWTVAEEHTYVAVLTTTTYATTAYLLLLAGLLALPAALLACCAVHKEDKCYLLMYTFLLLFVFLLEAAAGVLAYVYEEQVKGELGHTLQGTFRSSYGTDEAATLAIDTLQQEFDCCGALSYRDWKDSEWVLSGAANNNTVPDSCCKTPSPYCGVRDHPSNIWYNGCIHSLGEELAAHLVVLGAVGCGLCVLQVLGIVLACCLYLKLRSAEDHGY